MTYSEFTSIVKSKENLVHMLEQANYFLPKKSLITLDFLREILKGTKVLLKKDEMVGLVNLPRFRSICVKELWKDIKGDPKLQVYFPISCVKKKCVPDRMYLLSVS